ncbi:MAG: purine-binding chemotaxis protein CheW [Spirochaetales bacterium]|nr:purine-binding chemotaxis protein CheW [Spirochaetales bacterium]
MNSRILTFNILTEFYAIPIERVREIIRFRTITPVYDAVEYITGVINLRGQIIPILDFKLKLGLPKSEYTDKTVFIITEVKGKTDAFNIGLAVDGVHNVVDIDKDAVQDAKALGLRLKSDYINGVIKLADQSMAVLLDVDKVVNSEEILQAVK